MDTLDSLLRELARVAARLPRDEQRLVERSLRGLTEVAYHAREDLLARESLRTIATYLGKKTKGLETSSSEGSALSLRALRNDLVHSRSLRKYSPTELKALEPFLWRVLERSSAEWESRELTNFLAYCLQTPVLGLDTDADPKKIVRMYRAIFNAMPEQRREYVFRELVLRLFSERRFVNTLTNMDAP